LRTETYYAYSVEGISGNLETSSFVGSAVAIAFRTI
jgi:hypothetical protein